MMNNPGYCAGSNDSGGGKSSWVAQWCLNKKYRSMGDVDDFDPPPIITLEEIKYLTKKLEELESKPPTPVRVYSSDELSQEELARLVPSLNGKGAL